MGSQRVSPSKKHELLRFEHYFYPDFYLNMYLMQWFSITCKVLPRRAFIFISAFPVGWVAWTATLGRFEMPQGFQISQIVLLDPQHHGSKQSRRCNHASWSWSTSGPLSRRLGHSRTWLANLSWDILVIWPNYRSTSRDLFIRIKGTIFRVLQISQLCTLSRSVTLRTLRKKTN